jgi:hypothetical protein
MKFSGLVAMDVEFGWPAIDPLRALHFWILEP